MDYVNEKVGLLDRLIAGVDTSIKSLVYKIDEFCKENQRTITSKIEIPGNLFYRTELMCSYISEQMDIDFTFVDFLMLLYKDFIKQSVKNYNPLSTYKFLIKKHDNCSKDSITISDGSSTSIYYKNRNIKFKEVTLEVDKEEMKKGQLILDELEDLYNLDMSFDELLTQLWVSFIEDYKNGTNKRAYHSLIKILREVDL